MLEYVVLGALQGIVEWLPVSSEGVLVLAQTYFFEPRPLLEMINLALMLHLGTFFAALVYLWDDVTSIFMTLTSWKHAPRSSKALVSFLAISTVISGGLGFILLQLIDSFEETVAVAGQGILVLVGVFLLFTAFLQLRAKRGGSREVTDVTSKNSFLVGMLQGLAALPGLSRSGLTMAGLLFQKYSEAAALRLSFLLSLPIVLGANVVLQFEQFQITWPLIVGLLTAFLFGLLTIHYLLRIAQKTNFGVIVLVFGLLTIASAFVV